jgi:large repetitive protein
MFRLLFVLIAFFSNYKIVLAAPPSISQIQYLTENNLNRDQRIIFEVNQNIPVKIVGESGILHKPDLEYRLIYADLSQNTEKWQKSPNFNVVFTTSGHYILIAQVRNQDGEITVSTRKINVLKKTAIVDYVASSTTIIPAPRNLGVWVVNSDNDSVSLVNKGGLLREIKLPDRCDPRSIAIDNLERLWVSCFGLDKLYIINFQGDLIDSISLDYGSRPYGIVWNKPKKQMVITLYGKEVLLRVSTDDFNLRLIDKIGPTPRGIALLDNGETILVARFISGKSYGEVYHATYNKNRSEDRLKISDSIKLQKDLLLYESISSANGLPNYLESIAIEPVEGKAWITGKKDNIDKGLFQNGEFITSTHTLRTLIAQIDLKKMSEDVTRRRDLDNAEGVNSVAFTPEGDFGFVSVRGNNSVAIYDIEYDKIDPLNEIEPQTRFRVESAPVGITYLSQENTLAVQNTLSRSVSFINMFDYYNRENGNIFEIKNVPSITQDKLSPMLLQGKKFFYNSQDSLLGRGFHSTMSDDGYISCVACHMDGGHDGRVWDFTHRGEGLRNTIDLRGKGGMNHGLLHWSANFNEVQDFENDIRFFFGGTGLLADELFDKTKNTFGLNKTGLSEKLDSLAAYVTSLSKEKIPPSPYRLPNGSNTIAAKRGAIIFKRRKCETCHALPQYTSSNIAKLNLVDVGTVGESSGKRMNQKLTGFDIPTLLGLFESPPYLHNGIANGLKEVFQYVAGTMYRAEECTKIVLTDEVTTNRNITARGAHERLFLPLAINEKISCSLKKLSKIRKITIRYSALVKTKILLKLSKEKFRVELPQSDNLVNTEYEFNGWKEIDINIPNVSSDKIILKKTNDNHNDLAVDEITVIAEDDYIKAEPHLTVSKLSPKDQNDLISFLLELD